MDMILRSLIDEDLQTCSEHIIGGITALHAMAKCQHGSAREGTC